MTRILISAREDIKYSPRAIILLIGLQIVDIKQLDEYLAKVYRVHVQNMQMCFAMPNSTVVYEQTVFLYMYCTVHVYTCIYMCTLGLVVQYAYMYSMCLLASILLPQASSFEEKILLIRDFILCPSLFPFPTTLLHQSIESGRNLVALSCSIKLVNAIVSAEKRETPITDVRPSLSPPAHTTPVPHVTLYHTLHEVMISLLGWMFVLAEGPDEDEGDTVPPGNQLETTPRQVHGLACFFLPSFCISH